MMISCGVGIIQFIAPVWLAGGLWLLVGCGRVGLLVGVAVFAICGAGFWQFACLGISGWLRVTVSLVRGCTFAGFGELLLMRVGLGCFLGGLVSCGVGVIQFIVLVWLFVGFRVVRWAVLLIGLLDLWFVVLDFEFAVLGISAAVEFRAALGLRFGGLRVCTVGLVGFGGFLGKLVPWFGII